MDLRSIGGAAGSALSRFNARHPWSHNDRFHGWILRRLPQRRDLAIDVGCGRGELLSRLSPEFTRVEGTDLDTGMRHAAADRCAHLPNVLVDGRSLGELEPGADLLTMVAVLHHLDLDETLPHVRRILAPRGRLLVVGLARSESARDFLWDAASSVTNPLIGVMKHPRALRTPPVGDPFPVAEPELTFDAIRDVVTRELAGARLRRRLAFRYTLEWTKPGPDTRPTPR
ncbi:class I SAM-dependent methyltransferase [Gordonia iterans]|uniref:Class I SAM-dependent methyltransferase n=1 Tax=Gordonia iterans TaxID=1004901 RepID=A0A2S0KGV2_9ACTN|nr:class I SAM-dependent methyltransferase [Gordonia iterans]AVM00904.1 class I SAM-dependent methyltransferase [Gordonia iterans]